MFSLGFPELYGAVFGSREALISRAIDLTMALDLSMKDEDHEAYHKTLVDFRAVNASNAFQHPHALFIQPVYAAIRDPTNNGTDDELLNPIVGMLTAVLPWDRFLVNLLPSGTTGVTCVLANSCGQSFTYHLEGTSVRVSPMSISGLQVFHSHSIRLSWCRLSMLAPAICTIPNTRTLEALFLSLTITMTKHPASPVIASTCLNYTQLLIL
jgi:hypothetical protein